LEQVSPFDFAQAGSSGMTSKKGKGKGNGTGNCNCNSKSNGKATHPFRWD
jgi:hypothetical protein